jgi:hypothetical protein
MPGVASLTYPRERGEGLHTGLPNTSEALLPAAIQAKAHRQRLRSVTQPTHQAFAASAKGSSPARRRTDIEQCALHAPDT